MMSPDELLSWYQRLDISQAARAEIDRIRLAGPCRRVGGGKSNVTGRYPSRKMGTTIQFESHRVELAFVREMEHDPELLEFYDQPPSIPLDYESAKGRRLRVTHTPDFFVLRSAAAGWEECKTEEDLHRLAERSPNRYRWDNGNWHCPPGVRYASPFGLYYRVRSSAEIDWVVQRNFQFLENYVGRNCAHSHQGAKEWALAMVSAEPRMKLSELLLRATDGMSHDDAYALIANRELYVDLREVPLSQPAAVRVFASREAAQAWGHVAANAEATLDNGVRGFALKAGCKIAWDGRAWAVVNVGEEIITLLGEDQAFTELPVSVLEHLAREGRIQSSQGTLEAERRPQAAALASANEEDLTEANRRFGAVLCHLRGEPQPGNGKVSVRTLRSWVARYRKAAACLGSGYLGLRRDIVSEGIAAADSPRRPAECWWNAIMRPSSRRPDLPVGQC